MGVLDQKLFTLIVLMAVVTTLCMPPLLRWALAHVPLREEEKRRMDAEKAEQRDIMPKLERALVGLDHHESTQFASTVAGLLIGSRRLTATIMEVKEVEVSAGSGEEELSPSKKLIDAAHLAAHRVEAYEKKEMKAHPANRDPIDAAEHAAHTKEVHIRDLLSVVPIKKQSQDSEDHTVTRILAESKNGYDLVYLALGGWLPEKSSALPPTVEKIAREFVGSVAIFCCHQEHEIVPGAPLTKILVPTTGADYSRFGAEVAVAIAKGCNATVTALHVSQPTPSSELQYRAGELPRSGRAIVDDMVALAHRESVHITTKVLSGPVKENAILNEAIVGEYQLIILGTKPRPGETLHFGESVSAIIANAPCAVLVVTS
jgi:nucleotide-binding universal stress UspA family protein